MTFTEFFLYEDKWSEREGWQLLNFFCMKINDQNVKDDNYRVFSLWRQTIRKREGWQLLISFREPNFLSQAKRSIWQHSSPWSTARRWRRWWGRCSVKPAADDLYSRRLNLTTQSMLEGKKSCIILIIKQLNFKCLKTVTDVSGNVYISKSV